MIYYVTLVKATRAPFVSLTTEKSDVALQKANELYENWKTLYSAGLSVSGVSVQIYTYKPENEIGSPHFKTGIKPIYQVGCE